MSNIHVLNGVGNRFTVVIHATTPPGNNLAGISWADAIKNSGRAITIMTVGNGPGQISQSEANNVANGSVIEGSFAWDDNPAWTNSERIADLDLRAQQLMTELQNRYNTELKYFGFTR